MFEERDTRNITIQSSNDSEQAVLGGILRNPDSYDDVANIIDESDFFFEHHQQIFKTIGRLVNSSKPVDSITVGKLIDKKIIPYVGELVMNIPSAANIIAHANIVKDKSIERKLFSATHEINLLLSDNTFETSEKIDTAAAIINPILENMQVGKGIAPFKTVLANYVERLDAMHLGEISGLPTGFADIDRRLLGMEAGLYILAARPSMGKTTLGLNIAFNVAERGLPVQVFSLEMTAESLAMRYCASKGKINGNNLKTADLQDDEWSKLTNAIGSGMNLNIHIDDTSGLHINQIRARARALWRKQKTALIVVDYLQLIHARGESREREISAVSLGLKELSKELNVPVLCLSQLSRECEKRPNKRPRNSDLRDSGSIEQDADVIMFIYRDEVYNPETPNAGVAELITSKQRNGEIGTDYLTFIGRHYQFADFSGQYINEPISRKTKGGFDYGSVEN